MHRLTPAMFVLSAVACLPNNASLDAGTVDAGSDAGPIEGAVDAGQIDAGQIDGGHDGGDPDEAALSCDVPAGGDADDVELVQAWNSFVADDSHFSCEQDDDCVIVNYGEGGGDWCDCLGGGLTGKEGIALNAAAAEEAASMTDRALSPDCAELQALLDQGSCDGNPPIGAVCVDDRCALAFDPCGWCGTNGCADGG